VQFLPAVPDGADQVRRLQHGEVLGSRLARHVQGAAQVTERLAVPLVQPIEQLPSRRVSQRLEHQGQVLGHGSIMQAYTCMMQP
jgi:hypothetical protein